MKVEKYGFRCYSMCFIGLCCFFFSLGVQAQLRVGPKAGFQLARSVFEDEEYGQNYVSSFKPGMLAGVVLNYQVTKTYSLHSELFYNQKGKKVRNSYRSADIVQNTAVYRYIDLPVMLRLSKHQQGSRNIEYYFNIGPSFNYWLGGRGTLRHPELYDIYERYTISYKVSFSAEDEVRNYGQSLYVQDVNRLQMSLDFGGGIVLDLGRGHGVMIDLRNSLGVGKSFMGSRESGDFGLQEYNDNFEAVNHVFSLSVGYLLDIDVSALLMKGRRTR